MLWARRLGRRGAAHNENGSTSDEAEDSIDVQGFLERDCEAASKVRTLSSRRPCCCVESEWRVVDASGWGSVTCVVCVQKLIEQAKKRAAEMRSEFEKGKKALLAGLEAEKENLHNEGGCHP